MVPVEEAPVKEVLQAPPDALNIGGFQGGVGVLQVHPVGDALGKGLPLLLVGEDGLAAGLVEALNAVGLNLPLALEAELLLHLQLHGKPVGVPACPPGRVVAPHGLVAGEEVLVAPGLGVAHVGEAVGGGRALVDGVAGTAFAVFHALLEDLFPLPEGQDLLFQLGKVGLADLLEHLPPPSKTPAPEGADESHERLPRYHRASWGSPQALVGARSRAPPGGHYSGPWAPFLPRLRGDLPACPHRRAFTLPGSLGALGQGYSPHPRLYTARFLG